MPVRSARTLESGGTTRLQPRRNLNPTGTGFLLLAAFVLSGLLIFQEPAAAGTNSPGTAAATGAGTAGPGAATAVTVPLPENELCFECHGNPGFSLSRDGNGLSLYVSPAEYNQSRHGVIACIRCHEEVRGQTLDQHQTGVGAPPLGRDLKLSISERCGKCHAGPVLETYQLSFHFAALSLGGSTTASCADCHDAHNALPASDPGSTIAQANLPATCGQQTCHPGATAAFTAAPVHTSPQHQAPWSPSRIVWKAFIILILFDTLKDGPIILFELLRRLQPRALKQSRPAGREVDASVQE